MAVTYEQLTEILLRAGEPFTIEKREPNGNTSVYRGRDARAFLERRDGRLHEHKVFDPQGNLLYHRDLNGKLRVGHPKQWEKYVRRRKAGRAALSGTDFLRYSADFLKRRWLD